MSPKEFMNTVSIEPEQLFLMSVGPPCQGFSKNVPRAYRCLDDPNNQMVTTFLSYAKEIKPFVVLMENVAEMRRGFDFNNPFFPDRVFTGPVVSMIE